MMTFVFWIVVVAIVAIVAAVGVVDAQGNPDMGCVVDTSMYPIGSIIRERGIECLDDNRFRGESRACGEGGIVTITVLEEEFCPDNLPHCVPCGEDAALCVTSPEDVPEYCSAEGGTTGGGGGVEGGCLVGSQIQAAGTDLGHVSWECLNETSFRAEARVCNEDGILIIDPNVTLNCEGETPFCVQCGPPGPNSALCLDTPETPETCGPTEEGCTIGDVFYTVGQQLGQVGYECFTDDDNTGTFRGQYSTCQKGGSLLVTPNVTLTCPQTAPICVQCGPVGTQGGALCLANPAEDAPEDCAVYTMAMDDEGTDDDDDDDDNSSSLTTHPGSQYLLRLLLLLLPTLFLVFLE